ncbi:hypothetical protein DSECCO2_370050 [anaerobic digester metagenome]
MRREVAGGFLNGTRHGPSRGIPFGLTVPVPLPILCVCAPTLAVPRRSYSTRSHRLHHTQRRRRGEGLVPVRLRSPFRERAAPIEDFWAYAVLANDLLMQNPFGYTQDRYGSSTKPALG